MSDRKTVLKTKCVADAAGEDGGGSGEEDGTFRIWRLNLEQSQKDTNHTKPLSATQAASASGIAKSFLTSSGSRKHLPCNHP